jgi:hypothetical protein
MGAVFPGKTRLREISHEVCLTAREITSPGRKTGPSRMLAQPGSGRHEGVPQFSPLLRSPPFDDDEVSGTPMTIPALVHEITCCLAAYLPSARECGKKSLNQTPGTHTSKRFHSVLDSDWPLFLSVFRTAFSNVKFFCQKFAETKENYMLCR